MHAAIRYFARRGLLWKGKADTWGSPINLEELAGTLLAFSSLALDGMKKLQVEISDSDQAAYLHIWKVVGHLLGNFFGLFPSEWIWDGFLFGLIGLGFFSISITFGYS